ncbi:tautomerase family protein [Amycolatopsis pithecellobii]|uniref:4-oxalocrotonate tautomerase n=1 Tax=Amycolatopsis pithecellobii TaxID=664692 RepID=A0A6N7YHX7_9PSEU|nr:tautomerase family protein [Amycolatopsis pithecellobii]MTD52495.1 4-oxalocrotonate tautomerase [Amycolatopsis pithecellobii]
MPQVAIQVRGGREPESIRRLISAVTEAVVTTLDAAPATVRVIVTEVPTTHWANGDVTLAEAALVSGSAVHD